jgi:DNA-binding transcriptional LysR family regulator
MELPSWDLIRYYLAVARSGSTLKAARALKQSQPTVARKIDALEKTLGGPLFERRPAGYRLTDQGRALLPQAEAMEEAAERFRSKSEAAARELSGTVRFTTVDLFANHGLTDLLQAFAGRHPGVHVEVIVADRLLDLAAGEADVALRGRLTPGPYVCRKVAEFGWSAYCSRDYAGARGRPGSAAELARHVVIGAEGGLAGVPALRWLGEQVPAAAIRYRSNSMQSLVSSVGAGLGVAMLADPLAVRFENLVACFPAPAELRSEGWLLVPDRLKDQPHIRVFADFVAEHFARRRQAVQQS